MEKDKLIAELDTYNSYISMANDYYIAYLSLISSDGPLREVINLAPGFFNVTRYALVNSLMMMLSTLYDSSLTDKTFNALINQSVEFAGDLSAYSNRDRINQIIEEAQMTIQEMKENQIEILRKRRNKIYAHIDKKYFGKPEKMLEELKMSIEDIEKLLTTASRFCQKMINELDNRIVIPFSINSNDLANITLHRGFA